MINRKERINKHLYPVGKFESPMMFLSFSFRGAYFEKHFHCDDIFEPFLLVIYQLLFKIHFFNFDMEFTIELSLSLHRIC